MENKKTSQSEENSLPKLLINPQQISPRVDDTELQQSGDDTQQITQQISPRVDDMENKKTSQSEKNSLPKLLIDPQQTIQQISPRVDDDTIDIGKIALQFRKKDSELFTEHLLKLILSNAKNIPHDPKFPYLDEFANKINKNEDRAYKNIAEFIGESNKKINESTNRNLIFNGASTAIGATASLTYGIYASAGVLLPWLSAISIAPAMVNFVHKVKNGVDLNAYLEGRGYLLKYCENVAIMLICDVAERIEDLQPEDQEDAKKKLGGALTDLQEFNLAHYEAEPFYYKWSAQAVRQGLSNALGGARFGMGFASIAGTIIAPPVGMGITGAWVSSELVAACLYKKSHNLRYEKSIKAAEKLDSVFANIFTIYRKHLKIEATEQMQDLELKISPEDAEAKLINLCKDYKIVSESKNSNSCNDEELHHDHNYKNRYINSNRSSHNLGGEISKEKVKFKDLANVEIAKEDGTALPLRTHVHLARLTRLEGVQKISNCYASIAKYGAKKIEKATAGCTAKCFSSSAR